MSRRYIFGFWWCCLPWLAACSGTPVLPPLPWSDTRSTAGQAEDVHSTGAFHFGWRLSGNRAVAPLQVFDDGRRMWMQFAHGQPVPALFGEKSPGQGAQALAYQRQGAYVVLDAVWPRVVLRGGGLQSQVERLDRDGDVPVSTAKLGTDGLSAEGWPVSASAQAIDASPSVGGIPSRSLAGQTSDRPPQPVQKPAASTLTAASYPVGGGAHAPLLASSAPVLALPATSPVTTDTLVVARGIPDAQKTMPSYTVRLDDGTLRAVLARWAGQAGWQFQPEHWAVPVDIPVAGNVQFDPPFESAVEAAMAATELAEQPLRPCFYSNRVLRIVPYVQTCERSSAS